MASQLILYYFLGKAFENLKKYVFWISFFSLIVYAQHPSIETLPKRWILVKNVTIHTGAGYSIQDGILIFKDSVIIYVGAKDTMPANLPKDDIYEIDGEGGHLYPGLILLGSPVGLVEIEAIRATRDIGEREEFAPEVNAYTAFNVDSRILPTLLSNGILIVSSVPYGGIISGTSSTMKTIGWTKQEALIKKYDGLHIYIPGKPSPKQNEQEYEAELNAYKEKMNKIETIFKEAKAYAVSTPTTQDIKLDIISKVFSEGLPLYVHANAESEIRESIIFFKSIGVHKIILVSSGEIHKVLDFLLENKIPVVYTGTHTLPLKDEDPIDIKFKIPYLLWQSGIKFCIGEDVFWGSAWNSRNLPFLAGSAIAYGLPYEEAVKSVTSNCAEILQISNKYGSIDVGKSASFIISKGDIFDPPTSVIKYVFIEGKKIIIDDYHQYLFRRYLQR